MEKSDLEDVPSAPAGPGSDPFRDGHDPEKTQDGTVELKRDANGTILVPQPTDDPDEPLVGPLAKCW